MLRSFPRGYVRQGCSRVQFFLIWLLNRVIDQSSYGTPVTDTSATDLIIANDAVILAESLDVVVMALHEAAKFLRPQVFRGKTNVRIYVLRGLKDETAYMQSIHIARTLISWKTSYNLITYCRAKDDYIKKSYQGLESPMLLWTLSVPVQKIKNLDLRVTYAPCLILHL